MGSLEGLREHNRSRVIDVMRRRGTASRGELAGLTGLSRTTIATLVADLQRRGLVVEDCRDGRRGGRGRPPGKLRLHPLAGVAVGVDFGHRHLRVAVADLSLEILAERCAETRTDDAPAALDRAAAMVDEALDDCGVERGRVIAAGMGVPAPVDRSAGTVSSAALLPGWTGLAAAAELGRRLGVPVALENDANLGALAEQAAGPPPGVRDLIYVTVSCGIGAGMILGGRLHHGTTGVAGELGHVQVQPDGAVCRCGSRGCLGTLASAGPLLKLLRPTHGDDLEVRDLVQLVEIGEPAACRVVNDAGRTIGRVLADLVSHVNPEAIVVGGELSAASPLLAGIREAIDRHAQPAAARAVTVGRSALVGRAAVVGALTLVVRDTERLRSAGLAVLHG